MGRVLREPEAGKPPARLDRFAGQLLGGHTMLSTGTGPAAGGQARTQPLFNRLRSAQGAYATLGEFFRLCDQGGDNCAFSQGDPRRRYHRLAKRLLREPAQLPDGQGGTITVTYADLVAGTFGALYSPEVWPELAEVLQQLDTLTSPQAAATAVQALRARLRLQ